MSYAYSETDSGLVLAEQPQDEAAVRLALKQYDRDLRLLPPGVHIDGRPNEERRGYRVYRYCGSERPPSFVCFWGSDRGDPYPLSSRILDKVKELDLNTRSVYLDADAQNRLMREELARDSAAMGEELARDAARMSRKHYIAPRSVRLRQTRDRMRAKGYDV